MDFMRQIFLKGINNSPADKYGEPEADLQESNVEESFYLLNKGYRGRGIQIELSEKSALKRNLIQIENPSDNKIWPTEKLVYTILADGLVISSLCQGVHESGLYHIVKVVAQDEESLDRIVENIKKSPPDYKSEQWQETKCFPKENKGKYVLNATRI